jgi:hypothetical protein
MNSAISHRKENLDKPRFLEEVDWTGDVVSRIKSSPLAGEAKELTIKNSTAGSGLVGGFCFKRN